MRLRIATSLTVVCLSAITASAQSADGSSTAMGGRVSASDTLPSATLRPSLEVLKTALSEVRTERWKGSAAIRGEADANLASLRRDTESNLPALLAAADASPESAKGLLPAYRNVEALYDVLLRVAVAGRQFAPGEQSAAVDQALARLDQGRRALGDMLEADAAAAEMRLVETQAALKTAQTQAPPPVPVACPAVPTKKKSK